jgi:hypothetical protein
MIVSRISFLNIFKKRGRKPENIIYKNAGMITSLITPNPKAFKIGL